MGFREYLSEMPYYNMRHHKSVCPMGDIVDGSKPKYHYDLAIEFLPKGQLRSILERDFGGMFGRPKGVLPIYCNVHKILFMFDFDNGISIKPNGPQLEILKQVKVAMDTWAKNNNIKRKINIFT